MEITTGTRSWPTKNLTKKAPYNFEKAPWHTGREKKQKTAVSAPLYRALSHTSHRRSPDFAVRWRPEWPVLYRRRRRSAGRRPPAAARRTPPVSRSLLRSAKSKICVLFMNTRKLVIFGTICGLSFLCSAVARDGRMPHRWELACVALVRVACLPLPRPVSETSNSQFLCS